MEIPAGALEEEEKGRGGEDEGVGRKKGGWGWQGRRQRTSLTDKHTAQRQEVA